MEGCKLQATKLGFLIMNNLIKTPSKTEPVPNEEDPLSILVEIVESCTQAL